MKGAISMRYGFCTDIATKTRDKVEYELLYRIKEAGFDFAEFPLQMIETLPADEFENLLCELPKIGLDCDVVCNFFPKRVRLTGPDAKREVIEEYLNHAFPRVAALGAKKIVFGSCPARDLPDGVTKEEGFQQIKAVLEECIIPRCEKYGVQIVMEPIRSISANFINTLTDGMRVVNDVNDPSVMLLADIMHMSYENEDAAHISKYIKSLRHVHICEKDRIIPEETYSEYLETCLSVLKEERYDCTISFESKDSTSPDGLKKALALLKSHFNKI